TLPPGDEKHQPAILVRDSSGKVRKKYLMPSRAHLMVKDGDEVQAGDVLAKIPRETTKTKDITGGLPRVVELFETRKPKDPAVISEIDGSVRYGDIATISRKMMRWVKVEDVGDTTFLLEGQVDKFRFREENDRVIADGGRPAASRPLLLGITKASLSTDSFISDSSFQETTRVLTEAAVAGKVD